MKIVFDNLVDVKTGKLVDVEVESDTDVARLAETAGRADLAAQRFRAMFMDE